MPRKISYLQAILAAVLFGASAPFSKLLLENVQPVPLAGLLYLGSGIGAWLLFGLQSRRQAPQPREARLAKADTPWLLGAILAGGIAAPILLLWGLDQTPASTASLLLNFEIVATTLIAVLAFREAVDRRILLAIGLITLAAVLLSWTPGAWGFSLGALGVIGACFLWGVDNNLTRQISARNPLVIVGVKGLGAGTFSILLALLIGAGLPDARTGLLALCLGAVSYGLSIYLFILAMRGLGAARTSTLFGIAPFVGALLSLFLLQETPQALFWLAVPVMLAGAWLMLTEHHEHYHIHSAVFHEHPHYHAEAHHNHDHPGEGLDPDASHYHPHEHEPLEHGHTHTPDLDHRHEHED